MVKYVPWKENEEMGEETGDKREIDGSCDSDYMSEVMPRVGKVIRDAYHFVDDDTPIYLFLDNAGGHGTKDIVDMYARKLKDDWNVICVHQRLRSPVTNMLDLGVWMAFQNVVERLHFRHQIELQALARTVTRLWDELDPVKLTNVYNRWKLVLDLIIEDEGGDRLIESRRGKLYGAPSDEAEVLDMLVGEAQAEEEAIAAVKYEAP